MSTATPLHQHETDTRHRREFVAPRQRGHGLASQRMSLRRVATTPKSGALAWLPLVVLGADVIVLAAASILAGLVYGLLPADLVDASTVVTQVAVAGPLAIATWVGVHAYLGAYDRRIFGAAADEFRRVSRSALATAGLVGVACYVLRFDLARGWFALFFVIGLALVFSCRVGLRAWLKRVRQAGHLTRRVLVAGDPAHIDDVSAVFEREGWLGYEVVGALVPTGSYDIATTPGGVPVIGDSTVLPEVAREVEADVVVVASGAVESPTHLREIVWELEDVRAQVVVAPSLSDVSNDRVTVRPVGGLPFLHLEKPRGALAASRAKRLFDIVGSAAILLAASPALAFAALRIWAYDRGPILFRQERVGRDGETFTCLKFRTMAIDAEARLEALLEENGQVHGAFAKLTVDPRITTPGVWLRKFSIDELPQLVNVLRGDMSLVGPRPQTPKEVASYDDAMLRRLHVRPGMTGLWQVSGRSDLSQEESVRLDLYYVDNWSMTQDLAILGRTFGAVAHPSGAY